MFDSIDSIFDFLINLLSLGASLLLVVCIIKAVTTK